MSRLVVIGGSDAGISAALRAREKDPEIEIIVLTADRSPNFSICGIPFYLSREMPDRCKQVYQAADEMVKREGVHLLVDHRAESIDSQNKTITIEEPGGSRRTVEYDKLILCTGAGTVPPKIQGTNLPGVFVLRWVEESLALRRFLDEKKPASVVIVGGGAIGMEMVDALSGRGMEVTVVECADTVLPNLDPEPGQQVGRILEHHGVHVVMRTWVDTIEQAGSILRARGGDDFYVDAELVLVAAGPSPNIGLAAATGVQTGDFGAIRVTERMETNIADIYAAGDCAETRHNLTGRYDYLPFGATAHKQGRTAGENAAGGHHDYRGSLGTRVLKIFDWMAAWTGLPDREAQDAGFDPLTIACAYWDHRECDSVAHKLTLRMTGDRASKRVLGVQIIGHHGAEISKRVDIIATAIFNGMKMDEIGDLDLSCTLLSGPWDPLQIAAQEWMKSTNVSIGTSLTRRS